MLLKTSAERFPALEERLRAIHPYETPEIIALDPTAISRDYADGSSALCREHFSPTLPRPTKTEENKFFVTSRE